MGRTRFPVAVHVWLSDRDGRLLFQRRAGTGYADGYWSVPAGHVEAGETLHAACVREVLEETGVRLRVDALEFAGVQHKHDLDHQERIDFFFTARLPAAATPRIVEPQRCDGLTWAPADAPPKPLVPYVSAALEAWISRGAGLAYFGF